MTKTSAVKHYGSQYAVAKALGIHRSAVSRWGRKVPLYQAMRLAQLTNGRLVFMPSEYQ